MSLRIRPCHLGLVLLSACGDSGGASDGQTGGTVAGETEAAATSASPPTTTVAGTGDGTAAATSAVLTTEPQPEASTSTSTSTSTGTTTAAVGSTGDDTTGGPVVPNGCVTSVDGWCWTHPLPHGNRLRDIWDDGDGRVWVAGEGATLMFHDGQQWTTLPAAYTDGLRGIWGAAPDDVWAVGDFGRILHYDGVDWTNVASPTTKFLEAIWGAGPQDIWAVGRYGTVLHYDGVAWTPVDTDLAFDNTAVWGSAADDVWVGEAGFGGIVGRWDGVLWTFVSIDGPGGVTGLWGRGPNDVYATRDQGTALNHWSGGPFWDEIPSPFGSRLYTVVGDDADRLWAAGAGTMLEYTGADYVEDDDFLWIDTHRLARIGDDVLAVGSRGTIARRHDEAWTFEHGDPIDSFRPFNALAGTGPDDIWASGYATAHWDGDAWTFVDIGQGQKQLGDMSAAGGVIWAVAADGDAWLWRYTDGAWAEQMKLDLAGVSGLWAQDAGTVWMSGDFGGDAIARWDGQSMTTWTLTNNQETNDIHGLAPDDVWAVGSGMRLYHYDGQDWTKVYAEAMGEELDHVWAVGPDDVWAAASVHGDLFHWDGVTMTSYEVTKWAVQDLWGAAPDDVWAVGGELSDSPGVIYHWDGAAWTEQVSGSGEPLTALWGIGDDVWVAGDQSAILVLRR